MSKSSNAEQMKQLHDRICKDMAYQISCRTQSVKYASGLVGRRPFIGLTINGQSPSLRDLAVVCKRLNLELFLVARNTIPESRSLLFTGLIEAGDEHRMLADFLENAALGIGEDRESAYIPRLLQQRIDQIRNKARSIRWREIVAHMEACGYEVSILLVRKQALPRRA